MSGLYAFEVFDGSRSISPSSTKHDLGSLPIGKTLRIVAPDVFLDKQVKVEGGEDNVFEYTAPVLGRLSVRAARGDCKITLGKRDLGDTSIDVPIASGEYTINLVCPDGQNPTRTATVNPGSTARVTFPAR